MRLGALALLTLLWAQGLGAGPLDILTDTSLGDARRLALNSAVRDADRWLEQQTGLEIKGRFVVLGADRRSMSRVLDAGYARLARPRPNVPDMTNRICGGPRPNAIASRDFILVCWPLAPKADHSKALTALLVHEFFHQLQYDLARVRNDKPDGRTRKLGPAWMVEGSAEVFEMLYVLGKIPDEGRDFFNLQNPARRSLVTLPELNAHGSVVGAQGYGAARFAASLLARRHGLEKMVGYFRWLGRGVGQKAAFEESFGQSLQAFEEEFEYLRRNYGAARDWKARK